MVVLSLCGDFEMVRSCREGGFAVVSKGCTDKTSRLWTSVESADVLDTHMAQQVRTGETVFFLAVFVCIF